MANWAYVQNGEVKEVHDNLPKNWKNISGLNKSIGDIGFLNSVGWFEVEKQHQSFDDSAYQISGFNYSINGNKVTETCNLVEKEVEVITNETREELMAKLKELRNEKLKESDWSQLPDVQEKFNAEIKDKWKQYRQKLRDLPKQYKDTNFKIENIIWPEF